MRRGWSISLPTATWTTTRACSTSSVSWARAAFWTALVQKGVEENDTILIGEYQFDYIF